MEIIKEKLILTVIICCYNGENFIENCLSSLFNQNSSPVLFKILFIDDRSEDNTLHIGKKFFHLLPNLKILRNKKNKGLIYCCNKALKQVDTPYFMRLDVDDYLCKNTMEKIWKELFSLKEGYFITFHRWDVRDDLKKIEKVKVTPDIYTWIAGGTIFNTKAVRSVGAYSDEYWEEYDLYIKLLEAGYRYKLSSNCIYYYRRRHKSMTQDFKKNREGFENLLRKWGRNTLKKYGNFERILEYYGV